jgi:hypothetical protein
MRPSCAHDRDRRAAAFRDDPDMVDFHPLWESGTSSYIWQTFEGPAVSDPTTASIDDVLALLKPYVELARSPSD